MALRPLFLRLVPAGDVKTLLIVPAQIIIDRRLTSVDAASPGDQPDEDGEVTPA